ncbi:MAG: hypothetical protein AAF798_04140 [Bacteroidota bacterium]
MRLYLFLLLMLWLVACNADQERPNDARQLAAGLQSKLPVSVFDQPEGKLIKLLSPGTTIQETTQTTSYFSFLTIEGQTYCEPWLKIALPQQQEGWIFPNPNELAMRDSAAYIHWIHQKRMQAIWGERLVSSIHAYGKAFEAIQTAEDFVTTYQKGYALRDTLIVALSDASTLTAQRKLPDLFWLKACIPGFTPQLIHQEKDYYLFQDYKQWAAQAQRTKGKADDAFVDFLFQVFPVDSLEYTVPAWKIEYAEKQHYSLLGRGIHQQLLDRMQGLIDAETPFVESLNRIKRGLVEDITQADIAFWEPSAMAIQELDAILATAYTFLSQEDWIGLKSRRQQLEQPQQWGIRFHLKSGNYN